MSSELKSLARDLVVIGASTGGIDALQSLLADIPANPPAAFFVVQHIATGGGAYLPSILGRSADIRVAIAGDGDPIEPGTVYVAPADYHLVLDPDCMYLTRGPRENRVRPSIDPLFRSAALHFGPRVIGVVLSGSYDDGTAGMEAVQRAGGVTVVQQPEDAVAPDMPESVLAQIAVDHCEPLDRLARVLMAEIGRASGGGPRLDATARQLIERELTAVHRDSDGISGVEHMGELAAASCPECGGPMWQIEGDMPRFRCHTGHAYSPRSLIAGFEESEERALWEALRIMEERARMLQRLATRESGAASSSFYGERAEEAQSQAERLRRLLVNRGGFAKTASVA